MAEMFPDIKPDYSSNAQVRHRVVKVSFGDGYSQRAPEGINNKDVRYPLSWTGLSITERDQVIDFLDARGGVEAFNWTPWDSSQQLWTCDTYNAKPTPGDQYNISATFMKSYDYAV